MDLKVQRVTQQFNQLGRQLVHDPRSRAFAAAPVIDKSSWVNKTVRLYDPSKNPDQCHGECTGCAKAMEFNSVPLRTKGKVHKMDDAHAIYSLATRLDPWRGAWPPDDTGSSGLAAAKAAVRLGIGGEYRHVFGGADEVVQLIQDGRIVNVGTWWYGGMFHPIGGVIEPSGSRVGGHQYIARGYAMKTDMIMIRCWWGSYRDVWIRRAHLDQLLMDGGDAHIQDRKTP